LEFDNNCRADPRRDAAVRALAIGSGRCMRGLAARDGFRGPHLVYGYLRDHDLMAVRTEAEKYLMMSALNLVECAAFVGPDKPRR
jgi:hypothetical protein